MFFQVPSSIAQLPRELWEQRVRKVALCDFLGRSFQRAVQKAGQPTPCGKAAQPSKMDGLVSKSVRKITPSHEAIGRCHIATPQQRPCHTACQESFASQEGCQTLFHDVCVSAHRKSTAGADIRAQSGSYGGEKGGEMTVDAGGQHVLERTSVLISSKVWHSIMPEHLYRIKSEVSIDE